MEMCSAKFDLYHVTVAPNCFMSYTNSWCSEFVQKKVLYNVWTEILVLTLCSGLQHRDKYATRFYVLEYIKSEDTQNLKREITK